MYKLLRPLLFRMDAETSHDLIMNTLSGMSKSRLMCRLLEALYTRKSLNKPVTLMGIPFPNVVGLAAGLDKQGTACNALHAFGFGWLELGTVTPLPQPGNPRPRMFRLEPHQAIINRMGFNSIGLDPFIHNLQSVSPNIIKGINIGKNAATSMDRAIHDYLTGLNRVAPYANYVTINISSPNTKNLRDLQQDDMLDKLLFSLNRERQKIVDGSGKPLPLVLKIAPDLDHDQIRRIAELLRKHHIDGIAATNTTLSRDVVSGHVHGDEVGGLSGNPVHARSIEVIAALHNNLQGEIPIIGVGGIHNPQSALETLQAGADLLQIYTGLIYEGPGLISRILKKTPRHASH